MLIDLPRPDYSEKKEKKQVKLTAENSSELFGQLKAMFGKK